MPVVAAAQSVYEPGGFDIDDRDDGLRIIKEDGGADLTRIAGPIEINIEPDISDPGRVYVRRPIFQAVRKRLPSSSQDFCANLQGQEIPEVITDV
jgi:hypothetical protein